MQSEYGRRILVFAGTTEGRRIAEYLNGFPAEAYVSVATEYGKKLLEKYQNIHILCGRMNEEEILDLLKKKKIELVIDATHPYAEAATAQIRGACEKQRIPCLRCLREKHSVCVQAEGTERSSAALAERIKDEFGIEECRNGKPQVVQVDCVDQAVDYLKKTKGNIFIATGSKELAKYTQLENYRERCYARVLSTMESVHLSVALGFEGKHLIAMQGPFSREMNIATLRQVKADYFVTKDSGQTGGFPEKLEAARETNTCLVVVGRPREEGLTVDEVCSLLFTATEFAHL